MQLPRCAALLLFGAACAQNGPSITDILQPSASRQNPDTINAALGGDEAHPAAQSITKSFPNDGYGADPGYGGDGGVSSQVPQGPPSPTGTTIGGGGGGGFGGHQQHGFGGPGSFGGHEGGFGDQVGYAGPPHGHQPLVPHNIMSSLLDSIEGNMPGHPMQGGKAPISEESRLIVSGIVESFMHRVQLAPGERRCLENNLATLAADVVGTGQDLAKAIKALIPGQGPPGAASQGIKNSKTQGTLASAGMDGAMKITSLATMSTSLLKNCVQGDALEMLNATGRHFINMSYVGHRLLVSGVDIADALSDSIIAFEGHHFHRFGADIGTCFRKVLLSNATNGTTLPEGVPEEKIIQETAEGLMEGFFVRGSTMEITDSARPDVDIRLDLHRCIAGNQEFFKEIWMALWHFIAQMAANGEQHGMTNPFTMQNPDGSQPKWMGELMVAMMQVPMALDKCNIGQDGQQMLLEAIKSIQYLQVHFHFPRYQLHADEATKKMALAISAWTRWDFESFGMQIGQLLRDFVLLMYPQAYSVDANGRLRRQLQGKSASSLTNAIKVGGRPFSFAFLSIILGGVVVSLFVALVAVRGIRSMVRGNEHGEPSAAEDCSDVSDVELANGLFAVE